MTGGGAKVVDEAARRRTRLALTAVVLVVTLVTVVWLRQPNPAAVRLTGSDPADGAHLGSVPATVTLDFSGAARPATAHVVVEDPRGTTVSAGEPEISGSEVTQRVGATGTGLFQLGYHVTTEDGGELSGVLRFTVGVASDAEAPAPPDAAAGHTHLTKDPMSLLLILIDLVLTGVILVVLLRPRRRR